MKSWAKCTESRIGWLSIVDKQVKISVIMGVYNPEAARLKKAAGSIIAQSMEEWEMIIYDDGSDNTYVDSIYETAAMDKRITYIRNGDNHGLAYALNQCLKAAKGKYIARMDDDDESMPERFRKQYDFLETHPAYGWVGTNAELFDGKGTWGARRVPEIPCGKDFLSSSPYIHPSVMFRKEVLTKNYGYIPAEVTKRCEDYELFMRLYTNGYRGYNIQENLFRYRDDENAYRKRLFCYRLNEMYIRYRGFKRMGILSPATFPCVLRPLAGAIVPASLMRYIHKQKKEISTEGYGKDEPIMGQKIQEVPPQREKNAGA